MSMQAAGLPKFSLDADGGFFQTLPVALLALGPDGRVRLANDAARRLFPGFDAVGLGLAALFGLAGASGGGELGLIAEQGGAGRARVQLQDGRILDLHLTPADYGDRMLSLFDVSTYIRDAELGAKDPLTGLFNRAGFLARFRYGQLQPEQAARPAMIPLRAGFVILGLTRTVAGIVRRVKRRINRYEPRRLLSWRDRGRVATKLRYR